MPVEVTPQKSAEINERIGQLCETAASARKIAAELNLEFGLNWHPHTYWRRAMKSGYEWPRKVRRLTPEESEKMDQRLRELCEAGMLGTESRTILNNEFDLPWTFQTYFQRADRLGLDWTKTPRAERPWAGVESLPEDQRTACYEDPAYEARNKIADRVICRECFAMLRDGGMDGKRGHLWLIERKILECEDPGKVRKCYRRRNPGAPLFTFQRIAKQQGGLDVFKLMAKEADLYATPEERAAADKDPDYEEKHMPEYVICRELRCGFKSRARLTKHLANEHDIHGKKAVKAWRRQHDWAPIIAPDALDEAKRRQKRKEDASRKSARLGRKLTKRHKVFLKGREVHATLKAKYPKPKDPRASWGTVARMVDPDEFETDPRGAADRLRLGVEHLSKPSTKAHQR